MCASFCLCFFKLSSEILSNCPITHIPLSLSVITQCTARALLQPSLTISLTAALPSRSLGYTAQGTTQIAVAQNEQARILIIGLDGAVKQELKQPKGGEFNYDEANW